jgi:hypothetical protein
VIATSAAGGQGVFVNRSLDSSPSMKRPYSIAAGFQLGPV